MSKRFSLAVVKGPTDPDGKTNVIIPAYNNKNDYGYMICKESRTKDGGFTYTDISHFFTKEGNHTYQQALNTFKELFPDV